MVLWNYPCHLLTYSTPVVARSIVAPGNHNSYSCFKDSVVWQENRPNNQSSVFSGFYFESLSCVCVRKNIGYICIWISLLFYIFSKGGD